MSADDLAFHPALTLARLVRDKQLSPVDLVRAYLDRIERFDQRLAAYVTVCRDSALAAARDIEARIAHG